MDHQQAANFLDLVHTDKVENRSFVVTLVTAGSCSY